MTQPPGTQPPGTQPPASSARPACRRAAPDRHHLARRTGGERPARAQHPLAQADRPRPVPEQVAAGTGAGQVVLDPHRQRAAAAPRPGPAPGPRPRRMPQRVGQALLHHAERHVGHRPDRRPSRSPSSGRSPADRSAPPGSRPRRPARGPGWRPRVPASRSISRCRSSRPWRAESAIAARDARAASGESLDQPLPGRRLHDHHAQRVADDVVQLGGDAGALVAHRDLGEELALSLQLAPARGQLLGRLAAQPQHRPGEETRHGQDRPDPGCRPR